MVYITIFNTIVIFNVVAYLCYKNFPFYLYVSKTTWCEKPYSITLMMITSGKRSGSYSSKGIFTVCFRDYKKLNEWDSKMFHSGEYRQYKKQ
jgi:hypothetical protein